MRRSRFSDELETGLPTAGFLPSVAGRLSKRICLWQDQTNQIEPPSDIGGCEVDRILKPNASAKDAR
jgi:predicted nucleotide-binding protein